MLPPKKSQNPKKTQQKNPQKNSYRKIDSVNTILYSKMDKK